MNLHKLSIYAVLLLYSTASYCYDIADNRIFDWRFYLNANPDLVVAGYTTPAGATAHWKQNGVYEGRQGHPGFHSKQYLDKYSDLKQAFGQNYYQAAAHYLTNGYGEGRIGYFESYSGSGDNYIDKYGRVTLSNRWAGSWSSPIYLSISQKNAGAIDSIWWNGKEYINGNDHGRLAQYAWQYGTTFNSDWSFSTAYGECFNPTEAGSIGDDPGDKAGWTSRSRLNTYSLDKNVASTNNTPAYWANFSSDLRNRDCRLMQPYSDDRTNDLLSKTITVSPNNIPNLIKITAEITPENNDQKKIPTRIEAPTLYLASDLNVFYVLDRATPPTWTLIPTNKGPFCDNGIGDTLWPGDRGCEIDGPIIATNSTGTHAIGLVTQENSQFYKINYGFFYVYGGNETQGNPLSVSNTTKISVDAYTSNGKAPSSITTYIAVGDFETVKNTLHSAYSTLP